MKTFKLAAIAAVLSIAASSSAFAAGCEDAAGNPVDPIRLPDGTLTCPTPGNNVPEPGSWALVGLGLVAAVAAARAARR